MRRNLSTNSQKINALVRTSYTKPKNLLQNKKNNEPIKIKNSFSNNKNYYNYNNNYNYHPKKINTDLISSTNLNEIGFSHKKIFRPHSALKTDTWDAMISRTDPLKIKKVNYIKTNLSSVFPNNNFFPEEEKRITKKSQFSDYNTKTQITTLPGCVKRDKFAIKDDLFFNRKNNQSHLCKMVKDFNSNLTFDQAEPIGQGYNVNTFPVKERYYGSYKKGVVENDLFNRKKIISPPEQFSHKKLYANIKFMSQIKLV